MLQTIEPPRSWQTLPRVEPRPATAPVGGASGGDQARAGQQRLTGGETFTPPRRTATKVTPAPDPDPPTGPPPAFDVTPLEQMHEADPPDLPPPDRPRFDRPETAPPKAEEPTAPLDRKV